MADTPHKIAGNILVELTIGLWGMPAWLEGDFAGIVDLLVTAESKGFDRLDLPDHLLMSENIEIYPYAKVPPPVYRAHFYDPLTILAALAAVTSHIRLATGLLIAPLRSAVLLAKQAATIDVTSNGRLDLGLGVGWQKEEYDACGVSWEGRFGYMDEQVKCARPFCRQTCQIRYRLRIAFSTPKTSHPDLVWRAADGTEFCTHCGDGYRLDALAKRG